MELYVGAVGIIAGVFVVIFGGRGLIDLVRGYSERRRARSAPGGSPVAEQPVGAIAATTIAQEPRDSTEPTPAVPLVEPDPVYRRTFVGRDAELKQLHGAFDEALARHGSLAMVVGEPGIGKTSLCEQLAGYVAEKGGKTLVGHCYEEGSLSLPYLAFVEAVRSYVLVLEPEDLKAQLGQGADELARIVPEVRERMQVEPSPPGDAEEERYRLLQAASDFLRNAAAAQPLLVVLEDLHDADHGTLDMLTHLARNLSGSRLLVVGTYRDVQVDRAHPLSSALAELRRVTSFERIPLRGLTQDEVHRMLQAIAGHDVPWRWAEVVHRQTEGNPLFVQEVMRYLVEEGLLAREDGELQRVGDEPLANRIPEGLRDVIGKRMTRLSDACNRVLSVAAVIGRDFDLPVLTKVSGLSEDELLSALEEADRAAVIEEHARAGASLAYRFTHAFFRQTLYEEIFGGRRVRLHQQVGRALEEVHSRNLRDHATELAEHFGQSSEEADLAKAVRYGRLGAERAMGVYAYRDAVRLLEQALKAQEVLDPDDAGARCDLLLAFGEALMPAGEPQRVFEEVAEEALALAELEGDQPSASRACRMALMGLNRSGISGQFRSSLRLWAERADRHAPPGTVDRVYADASLALAEAEGTSTHREAAERAWELALELGDPPACFFAARLFITLPVPPKYHAQRLQVMTELLELPRHAINPRSLAGTLHACGFIRFGLGDRNGAEALWQELEKLAGRTRDPSVEVYLLLEGVLLAYIDGDLEEAVARRERLLARSDELGSPFLAMNNSYSTAVRALGHLGRGEEALALLAGFTGPMLEMERALLGYTEEMERALAGEWGKLDSEEALDNALIPALEATVAIGDAHRSEALARHLAPSSSIAINYSPFLVSSGRLLGEVAVMLGRIDEARAYFRQAIDVCTKVRFRPEIALTRQHLAELLLDHYPDERANALEHLDFAIAEFRDMKMAPALEQALGRQQSLKN